MKVLTTLLAAASLVTVASADITSTDLNGSTGQTVSTGNHLLDWTTVEGNTLSSSLSDWALTFTVDNITGTSSVALISAGTGNNTSVAGLSVRAVYDSDSESFTLQLGRANIEIGETLLTEETPSLTLSTTTTYVFAYDSQDSTVYLADTSTGNYIAYEVSDNSTISPLTLSTSASRQWSNNGADTTTVYTVYDISSIAGTTASVVTFVTTIPEPATATLSLLALAGLAARRRRK